MVAFKIPKRWKPTARTAFDPAGVDPLGINDMIFGSQDKPDYSADEAAQAQAIAERQAATDEFIRGGPAKYEKGSDLTTDMLGNSRMDSISTDPQYREAELSALRDLEEQAKDGFTARDRADMAKIENEVNRANRGRIGAIKQNMQARGMSGSGMDLVAQMQSAQDANEIEALRALEKEGMALDRKQSATAKRGSLASQLQGRDFNQESAKARAADEIARFNNQIANSTRQTNWQRNNNVNDNNVNSQYQFNKDRLGAKTNQSGVNYDVSVENQNRKMLQDQQNEQNASGAMGAIGSIGGGIVGAIYGGPAGATAGSSVGGGVGQLAGRNTYKNQYRSDERCKEDIEREHPLEIEAFMDSIQPKSYKYKGEDKEHHGTTTQDLKSSNIGRSIVVTDEEGIENISVPDAISALLEAVSHLNKKVN